DLQLLALGNSRGHQVGNAIEIARIAMVLAARQLPVRLFPVIGVVERAAQSDVGKQWPAQIEGEALHSPRTRIRKLLLDHALFAHGRKIAGRRPLLAAARTKPVELVGSESSQADQVVAAEFVATLVDLVLSDRNRPPLAAA